MKHILIILFISWASLLAAQTRQDSVTVTPMASVPTVAVDGQSVFAMQSIIDGKSKWTKFSVEALTAYLNVILPLTEAEVDAFVSNNGYLTTVSWNDLTDIPAGFADGIDNTSAGGADWTEITNIPTDIADGDDDTQLSEAEVDAFVSNNGYLTSYTETDPVWVADSINYASKSYADQAEQDAKDYADANDAVNDADFDPTNEYNTGTGWNSVTKIFSITDGGGTLNTTLTDVLTSEVDGSTTNEIQSIDTFQITSNTLELSLDSDGEAAKTVDLSGYLDNTDAQTLGVTGDDITLTNGGSVSVINTVESNTAASTTITVDLQSARNRIVQVDMTSASTASTVTLSVSNPVTGGVYTFHFQNTNVGGHDIDFPANVLQADGTAWDGSTTVNYAADDWLTCYYDGTNYHCK